MTGETEPRAIRWRRVWRLITGLRPFGRVGNTVANLLILAAFVLVGFGDLVVASEPDMPISPGTLWFVLLVYGLHVAGGLLNRGWRELPVTTRERRAAAWLMVSGVPLLLAVVVGLADVAIAALTHHGGLAGPSVALFALRALVIESYALAAIVLGNWPGTMDHYWQVTQRQARDWLMIGVMFAIMVAVARFGSALAALGVNSWPVALAAAVAAALMLPLAQRVIRLDRPSTAAGLLGGWADRAGGLPTIRWSGWRGHFGRTTLRVLVIWALAMAYGVAVFGFVQMPQSHSTSSTAFKAGFALGAAFKKGFLLGATFGAGSALWVMPAVVGGMIAAISQQYLLRARVMLLSLPGGDRLVLITPAYSLAIAFAATLLVVSPWLGADRYLALHLVAGAALALAAVQGLLALNLGVVSYAGLLRNAAILAPIGGAFGFAGALVEDGKVAWLTIFAQTWVWLALIATALLLAVVATGLCRWQLRAGRKPYRPWPGAGGGWRGA